MTSAKRVQSHSVGEPCPCGKWPILNQIQFMKTETGHRATKANEKRSLERERDTKRGTNQGQEPETVPGKRAKTDWRGTQEEQPWSSDYFWAFPDVSAFAPKSLKITNVSH